MTQEDKNLLLKDLCVRLPYGVKVHHKGLMRPLFSVSPTQHFQITLDNALDGEHNGLVYVSLDVDGEVPKSYLRPMSSMTEEEKQEYHTIIMQSQDCSFENGESATTMVNDWLNAHHFDTRGLIPKGLAIAVTEGNNPYKD